MFRRNILSLVSVWTILIIGHAQNQEMSFLRINQPQSLAQQYPDGVPEKPAMFGIPTYAHGSTITGMLAYPQSDDLEGCFPIDKSRAVQPWPTDGIVIVIVDRGNCTFVSKVRHCEEVGANAAIIVDNKDEINLPYMADDGTGQSLTIPSMLIHKNDGEKIKMAMLDGAVVVTFSWNLPHPDNRVEWEFWTSSNDDVGLGFKQAFKPAVQSLGDQSSFVPRYFIRNGRYSGCTDPSLPCGAQCTNMGRYCAIDPEHDFEIGLDGAHVIRENLRQICLFQYLNSTGNQVKWWDYVTQFDSVCGEQNEQSWNKSCSQLIMTQLGIDYLPVFQCVTDSGGSQMSGGENSLLTAALTLKQEIGIFFMPTITINGVHYRGSLSCPGPIDIGHCGVLSSICAGYKDNTEPNACHSSPGCRVGLVRDDCGVCGGNGTYDGCGRCLDQSNPSFKLNGKIDPCGVCLNPNDPNWAHTCSGCDDVPHSSARFDECGICNGPGRDVCGKCAPLNSTSRVPEGRGGYDKCGKCLLYGDRFWDATCQGCDRVPNSGKIKDSCGICGGPGADACGRCLGQSSRLERMSEGVGALDRCGRCLKFVDPIFNSTCFAPIEGGGDHIPIYVIVLIIIGSLVVAGVVVFLVMRERERRMKRDIDSLLRQYLPLETTGSINDDRGEETTELFT